jgi:hypothetical protein
VSFTTATEAYGRHVGRYGAGLELDPAAPDEGRTMRYCSPEELVALWRAVSLQRVETRPLAVSDGNWAVRRVLRVAR